MGVEVKQVQLGEPRQEPGHDQGVAERPEEGQDQDGPQVVEEVGVEHGVGRVQDDWRKQDVEEEVVGELGEGIGGLLVKHEVDDDAQQHAQDDEDAGLRKDFGNLKKS